MLAALFGNRNIERILLFLFINGQCYGTQLQRLLHVPLTPIQKALQRLEKARVITSHYEGKNRLYTLNSNYPLRVELESLLKKAYTLLPTQEKKHYCFLHRPKLSAQEERIHDRDTRGELTAFWKRLSDVQHLTFSAKSRHRQESVSRMGVGEVAVIRENPNQLTFKEKGQWLLDAMPNMAFNNSLRWNLDIGAGLIALEHLRFGAH